MATALTQARDSSARLQIRLPRQLHQTLEACAERSGLSVVGLVRVVLEDFLAASPATVSEAIKARRGNLDLIALSALVACEQTLKLLELVTPGARRFSIEARAEAWSAAEDRLQEVRTQLEAEG